MEYSVELTQVASKGTVTFTTNFGFSFLADLVDYGPEPKRVRSRRPPARHRLLRVLSPCHGAIYDQTITNGAPSRQCHVCKEYSVFPLELIEREYPAFDDAETNILANLVAKTGPDALDSVIIVESLVALIEELWDAVKSGSSVRNFLNTYEIPKEL